MMIAIDPTAPAPPGAPQAVALVSTEGGTMNEFKILQAARVAAMWHAEQRRKGAKQEPYINHLIEVAEMVALADAGNTDLVVAALLHDAIEDQKKSREEIAELFGDRVADLVVEVTDNKALPKPDRKRLQVETAPHKSRDAKLLKLADKASNLRSIAVSPPAHWSLERRVAYIEWASAVVAGLWGVSDALEAEFVKARDAALAATV